MKLTCAVIIVFSILASGVMAGEAVAINTTPVEPDYYAWITEVSCGPREYFNDTDTSSGYEYRVVVTVSEIYNQVFIELITMGDEGSGKEVASAREVDLYQVQQEFDIRSEISGFELIDWLSVTSFIFKLRGRFFLASNIDQEKLSIEQIK